MKEFWDSRYGAQEYAYGTRPNVFFETELRKLTPGRLLLPAEGEGRNAVFAAELGWEVHAFDISDEGKNKALRLAEERGVTISYEVGSFEDLEASHLSYDAIGLIFAHFPPPLLLSYHQRCCSLLNPEGTVILEGFSKDHLEMQKIYPNVGGPQQADFLFSVEGIQQQFAALHTVLIEETETELDEGLYHRGRGKVVRFVGRAH
ncbi:MAG: class I SAM-dependent methyltransferase [Flavobacteriales bacterium]|nr:class I SAM-dependent methyltransferase [Flavobacteriales bacterium]